MTFSRRGLVIRAIAGFALGVFVCVVYWMTGGIPREVWFDSLGTDQFIKSKMWFWPSAVLDVVFRETRPQVAAVVLYAINGLTYLVISVGLFALRGRPWLYVLLSVIVLGTLAWFNASVMQTFSWLWFLVVVAALGLVGYWDLRLQRRSELSAQ